VFHHFDIEGSFLYLDNVFLSRYVHPAAAKYAHITHAVHHTHYGSIVLLVVVVGAEEDVSVIVLIVMNMVYANAKTSTKPV